MFLHLTLCCGDELVVNACWLMAQFGLIVFGQSSFDNDDAQEKEVK